MQSHLQAWLARQSRVAGSPCASLWLRKGPAAEPERVALHPPEAGAAAAAPEHADCAKACLAAGRPLVRAGEQGELLAAPAAAGALQIAAVLEQPKAAPREQAARLDRLATGLDWLAWDLARSPTSARATQAFGAARSLDLLASALEERPLTATAMALTTELATLLGCERVSLARFEGGELEIDAISHSARLDARTQLARDLIASMQEAIDQDAVVVFPQPADRAPLAVEAHRRLAEGQSLAGVWSLPLRDGEDWIGCLLVELAAGQSPPPGALAWLEQLGSLLAPILAQRRQRQSTLGEGLRRLLSEDLPEALGWGNLNVRLAVAAGVVLLCLLAALPATHRVASPARLEGVVQRAIVAPMQAYVAESRYRAGDLVEAGQVLGVLEDADLKLEARKWQAVRAQRSKELRAAIAEQNRSQARILQAQVEQADAELALIEEQRRRTRLVAPFDGVVTHGDLSQALGSPVERGEVLFEVAPLDDYRIMLEVDSRDIARLQAGQTGELTLEALPGRSLDLTVRRITPIAVSEDRRSYFRVEAALDGEAGGLRPGMNGVAKIAVGERSLLWIWTHSVVEWLRFAWWAWLP